MIGPRHSLDDVRSLSQPETPETVLLIGRVSSGTSRHFNQRNASIVVAPYATINRAFVARVAPQTVAFALMGKDRDAAQILAHLESLRYSGEAIIFAPRLPDRDMFLRELRLLAPGLARISLLELPEG